MTNETRMLEIRTVRSDLPQKLDSTFGFRASFDIRHWGFVIVANGGPSARLRYSSRNAAAIGSRAARIAGKNPPTRPIKAAPAMPVASSHGVTAKANVTWLKLCQFNVAVWKPSKAK